MIEDFKYYVINQRGSAVNITRSRVFEEFLMSKADITEHLKAQLAYIRDGHPEHKIQPIVIGVTSEKFLTLIDELTKRYSGFLSQTYLASNSISIKLTGKGSEIIRIINDQALKETE